MGAHRWHAALVPWRPGPWTVWFGFYTANHGASAPVDPDARGHSGLGFDDADPVATASLDRTGGPFSLGRVQPLLGSSTGVASAGALWAFMPCGLLYSALLVAALSGGPLQGAWTMALFAVGQRSLLVAAPGLAVGTAASGFTAGDWGTRISGALSAVSPCGRCGWIWYTSPRSGAVEVFIGLRQQRFQDRACRRATVRIDVRAAPHSFVVSPRSVYARSMSSQLT